MPVKLDVQRKLLSRSDRVKCCDLHPTEPLMLASLFTGQVHVWNYDSQELVKSFDVCGQPVRSAKFVSRKNWIITGSDDMIVRVFDYSTRELIQSFEAHTDYIRSICVHPTRPYLLTASDDKLIKQWNWDENWSLSHVYEGHSHYVMEIAVNPKDTDSFASASLDRTVKVWQLGSSSEPMFTLEGHEKGVNSVDYCPSADKPYLISGGDDHLVKIWDYQTGTVVQILDGHTKNVSSVRYHPRLPMIIMTGAEDGTIRLWDSVAADNHYRLERTLDYGLERVWSVCCLKGSDAVAVGYDEGSIVLKLVDREEAEEVNIDPIGGVSADELLLLEDDNVLPLSLKDK
ncbi:coatomer subunit beta'-like [Oppia nitens]|uniref:coatomer subunit beta'-like n=1 Tax=Oppia nitens TaxID=1686743 RepID=UPI0023DB72CF|nr:coatomer subunit beta'-like [Oppia nitens]